MIVKNHNTGDYHAESLHKDSEAPQQQSLLLPVDHPLPVHDGGDNPGHPIVCDSWEKDKRRRVEDTNK